VTPIAFCHVPKTGGTTVHQVLATWVEPGMISAQLKSEGYSTALRASRRLSIISGHFWFYPAEALDRSRLNVTVLRAPVDRVLSHYHYIRSLDPKIYADAPERTHDLASYVNSELPCVRATTQNFQTRLLAPLGMTSNLVNPSDSELLACAMRAVDLFDLVGVFSQLEETVDLMACMAQAPTVSELPHERATTGRAAIETIPVHIRHRLEALNELDQDLYAYAQSRFRQRHRQFFIQLVDNQFARTSTPRRESDARPFAGVAETVPAPETGVKPPERIEVPARFGNRAIEVRSVRVSGEISLDSDSVLAGETVSIEARIAASVTTEDLTIGLRIHDKDDRLVLGTNTWLLGQRITVAAGSEFCASFSFRNTLGTGSYRVGIMLHTGHSHLDCCYDWFDNCASINVAGVIGYHFEGAVSLAVAAHLVAIEGPAPILGELAAHTGQVTVARHNPAITVARGQIRPTSQLTQIRSGDVLSLEVELRNACDQALECDGLRPMRVCYRWLEADTGRAIQAEGIRTNLGIDLRAGQVHRARIALVAPPNFLGNAILRLVPVQENVGWFDELGSFFCDLPVLISA
jgi:Wzt C-terminal domain/Sulfotransferase family